MDPVGDLAGHAQHPRVHGGDEHGHVRVLDPPRGPLRGKEAEPVVRALEGQRLDTLERAKDRLQREHVLAQPRTRRLELGGVAALHVRLHLRPDAEEKPSLGLVGELPRDPRGDHRAARERHCDAGAQRESWSRKRGGPSESHHVV